MENLIEFSKYKVCKNDEEIKWYSLSSDEIGLINFDFIESEITIYTSFNGNPIKRTSHIKFDRNEIGEVKVYKMKHLTDWQFIR